MLALPSDETPAHRTRLGRLGETAGETGKASAFDRLPEHHPAESDDDRSERLTASKKHND